MVVMFTAVSGDDLVQFMVDADTLHEAAVKAQRMKASLEFGWITKVTVVER